MKFSGEQFESEVYRFWMDKLNIPSDVLDSRGAFFALEEELDSSARIIIYHLKELYFIRVGIKKANALGLSSGFNEGNTITPNGMKKRIIAQGIDIKEESTLLDFFLDPKDFHRAHTDGRVRQLDKTADMESMQALFSACTAEELDDADIYTDNIDPFNFGIVETGKLIAYSSYRMFGDHICDPGVLVHPRHRNKGLGKAVISALCEHCFENNIIPMYRVFEENINSTRIPRSLGFRLLIKVHVFTLNKP